MNAVALYFASGQTFFWGIVVLLALSAARLCLRKPPFRPALRVAAIVAILLVGLSATPLPYWLYGLWAAPALAIALDPLPPRTSRRLRRLGISAALIVMSIFALIVECPYHVMSRRGTPFARSLIVIGDSITAGVGDDTVTWPRLLDDELPVRVVDLSRAGETCAYALPRAEAISVREPSTTIILLEIGGNDMLGWTSVSQFRRDLDRLLAAVSRSGATVYLMELPLPPLHNGYGAAQRALARKHGALLIPKRFFARVLAAPGATSDGLHLSQRGGRYPSPPPPPHASDLRIRLLIPCLALTRRPGAAPGPERKVAFCVPAVPPPLRAPLRMPQFLPRSPPPRPK